MSNHYSKPLRIMLLLPFDERDVVDAGPPSSSFRAPPVCACMRRAHRLWSRTCRRLATCLAELDDGTGAVALPVGPAFAALCPFADFSDDLTLPVNAVATMTRALDNHPECELIHDLVGYGAVALGNLISVPIIASPWPHHVDLAPYLFAPCAKGDSRRWLVAPTLLSQTFHKSYRDVLHTGFDLLAAAEDNVPASARSLAVIAPLSPQSHIESALDAAARAKLRVTLIGPPRDITWFSERVAPRIDNDLVKHIFDSTSADADETIATACAVLHVGGDAGIEQLALIEALSYGVPIVAIHHGDIALLQPNRNGIIVDPTDLSADRLTDILAEGLVHLNNIDRSECRASAEPYRWNPDGIQHLRALYEQLLAQHRREESRPWGHYRVLADESDHKVKRLVVHPGKRLSLQRHRYRSEHWYVLHGQAMVVRDDDELRLLPGQCIDIPQGAWHRIRNPSNQDLSIIEVQTGSSFAEDDIERREDDYGRANT